MKNTLTFIVVSLFLNLSLKAECKIKPDGLMVKWTAFKTPKKVGVGGQFTDFDIKTEPAKTLAKALKGTSLKINSTAISTGNKARDKKIVKHFFSNVMGEQEIMAVVKKANKKSVVLDVTMNQKTQEIPLTLMVEGNTLSAKGHLDILDFSMSKSLKAINKACYALHEGKTWSHVELEVVANLTGC